MPTPSYSERIAGGIMGLLIGDALGVPYEFRPADQIPDASQIEYVPPRNFPPAHLGVKPGTWSDDGAQALCLMESLLRCDEFDPNDFSKLLVDWIDKGHNAVDNMVFDIGRTTQAALARLGKGVPALEAGLSSERDNGNGSLMRVLPLALFHRGSDAELVHDAMLQSQITHAHPRSKACCALYCLFARKVMKDAMEPWLESLQIFKQLASSDADLKNEVELIARYNVEPTGTGYVIDSLFSVLWALEQGSSYEQVVKAAISLGNDTDTTACIAGGIAGIRGGLNSIPERWRRELRGQSIVKPLLHKFIETLVASHAAS